MDVANLSIQDVFKFDGKQVRVAGTVGKPWFCGKDVAEILGYNNIAKTLKDHVDDEDKIVYERIHKRGNKSLPLLFNANHLKATYINESGLYSLILRSRLDNAKSFKRWVTSDVFPSIRKRGYYKGYPYPQVTQPQLTRVTFL